MKIITNNPYRFLGVFSNSPTKERVANKGKMTAFLRVGKQVSFPLDLPQHLSSITRTTENVQQAEASLTLPKDQMKYAQFWFVKTTPIDNVAFNNLFAGNMDTAISIWEKKECASSLQNRLVCALITQDYARAIACAEKLYTVYVRQFVSEVICSQSFQTRTLVYDFLDILCKEIDTDSILPYFTIAEWQEYIISNAIQPLISQLQTAIDSAKSSKDKGSYARLQAGETLMNDTRKTLAELKKYLNSDDIQYQTIADKLGLEILQCGIDYYNGTDDYDAAYKAMTLQKYAQSIVVGAMAKGRCKENVDILNDIIAKLPPKDVLKSDNAVKEELRKYCLLPDKICHAVTLLNNTKPHLQSIKAKLGADNAYYLKLSTQVVSNALHNLIAEVNATQESERFSSNHAVLKTILKKAWDATLLMNQFDKEKDFCTRQYLPNYITLQSLCQQMGVSTDTESEESDSDNKGKGLSGCSIILLCCIVGLIIFFAIGYKGTPHQSPAESPVEDSYDDVDSVAPDTTDISYGDADTTGTTEYSSPMPPSDNVTQKEETEDDKYADYHLKTGAKPYTTEYGKGKTGDNYLDFRTSGAWDYIVIVRKASNNRVVNHVYIRGGQSARLYLPDGTYTIYFYSGRGWNPHKQKGNVVGGFVSNESTQKDENVSLYDQYGEYTLYPVQNGNLTLDYADDSETF